MTKSLTLYMAYSGNVNISCCFSRLNKWMKHSWCWLCLVFQQGLRSAVDKTFLHPFFLLYIGVLLCLYECVSSDPSDKLSDTNTFLCDWFSGSGGLKNLFSVIQSLEWGGIASMQSRLGMHIPPVCTCHKMSTGGQPTILRAWSDTTIIITLSMSWGSLAGSLCQNPAMAL